MGGDKKEDRKRKRDEGSKSIADLLEAYGPEDFVMGIDEAGRGPVLGPMVYGGAFCRLGDHADVAGLGVGDSKKFKEEDRDRLREKILNSDFCEHVLVSMSAEHISGWMQQKSGSYNLNSMSHDAAIHMVDTVLKLTGGPVVMTTSEEMTINEAWAPKSTPVSQQYPIDSINWKKPCKGKLRAIYVDTVGPPDAYKKKLQALYPFLHITVESKADDNHPIVGAASIMAKTDRDAAIAKWKYEEPGLQNVSIEFGTGYPSEPLTKEWLRKNIDPVFGYPNIVRFSWGTVKEIFDKKCLRVTYGDDREEDQPTLLQAIKKRRGQFLEEVGIASVTDW